MASSVDIANSALTKLGQSRIMTLEDNVKGAREINAIFELRRDKLLRTFNWSFAMKREQLNALADEPSWGYSLQYQFPSDCLRMVQVNDIWVIPSSTDFVGGPDSEPFSIEGRRILTDWSAPLKVRYIRRVTNPGEFDASFVEAFAYDLAHETCESLTQSTTKKESMKDGRKTELMEAIRSNAIELPPQVIADDGWLAARF
jgi:hypothetical protein